VSAAALNWDNARPHWPHAEASRFVAADGLTWHTQIMGDGPSILLLHGTGASTHSWRDVMPLLAARHQVIAIDLPGHGFTSPAPPSGQGLAGMAQGVAALLEALAISPQTVAGHSAGAAILARMCSTHLIAPEKLISFNGAFYPVAGFAGALFSPLAKLIAANSLMPRIFSRMADEKSVARLMNDTGSTLNAEGLRLYQELFQSPGHVAATLGMMAQWDLSGMEADLARVNARSFFVRAANDRTIAPDAANRAARAARHGSVIEVANLGHLMHEENPRLAAEIVAAPEHHDARSASS
jgi:magnesium chelatase accessory protein